MKSDFAYASHQFRTPITQAMSALSLAEEEKSPKLLKDDLAMAQIGLESVHRLSLKLLAMSEVDSERVEVSRAAVNLPELISRVKEKVLKNAAKPGTKIEVKAASGLPGITSDPTLLENVVTELLYNAMDYGEGEVRVEVKKKDREVVLAVRNQGTPISEEDQPQIFNKFFRGSNRLAEVSGGGLGLYLVREYVRLLGGKVWFESTKEATVFWVSVPID